ncbi:hypothetical protein [Williamsia sp. 1135]|uniref:hypothetical protein n=1 Tax=Williamsia sp. 1135 TaxID=1889262 RepID=UPI000A106E53|nr:hypothetical protein [Williamsia sp. 1135]ORM25003.1 hypothetical protein BFL43_24905 [Williamsia sp. 1135]
MAISTIRPQSRVDESVAQVVGLPEAVLQITRVTPDRVVVRYRSRVLNYRDLTAAINLMMPVTRSQQMDDRAAVVAAIFAGIPALGSEPNAAAVTGVVDGALAQIATDLADLNSATAPPRERVTANRTSEMDLRVIASRLTGK